MFKWIKEHKFASVLLALVGGTVGLVGGIKMADRPWFCGLACHEMQYYVDSLAKSRHGNSTKMEVICMDCHSEQGFINHTIEHVKASLLITEHFNEHYKEDHKGFHKEFSEDFQKHPCQECHPGRDKLAEFMEVPDFKNEMVIENCQRCHEEVLEGKSSPIAEISIPHSLHKEKNVLCTQCHRLVVHGTDPQGFNKPSMHVCFEKCHDDKKATRSNCEACHGLPSKMFAGTGGREVPDTAGIMTGAVKCPECHIQKDPPTKHGAIKYEFNPQSCVDCHSEGYDKQVADLQKDYTEKLEKLEERFKSISKKAEKASKSEPMELLNLAEYNLEMIKRDQSRGVHNPQYIDAIATVVNTTMDEAGKKLGE